MEVSALRWSTFRRSGEALALSTAWNERWDLTNITAKQTPVSQVASSEHE